MKNGTECEYTLVCVHVYLLFSAGIGRTGTFIVIDMILNEIKSNGLHPYVGLPISVLSSSCC